MSPDGGISVTKSDGGTFSALRFDAAYFFEYPGYDEEGPDITATGVLSGGGTVTQIFSSRSAWGLRPGDGASVGGNLQRFTLGPGFANLTSLSLVGGFYMAWDNIEVETTPVPEPATFATAGLGVLMGLGYAWRRRRAG